MKGCSERRFSGDPAIFNIIEGARSQGPFLSPKPTLAYVWSSSETRSPGSDGALPLWGRFVQFGATFLWHLSDCVQAPRFVKYPAAQCQAKKITIFFVGSKEVESQNPTLSI